MTEAEYIIHRINTGKLTIYEVSDIQEAAANRLFMSSPVIGKICDIACSVGNCNIFDKTRRYEVVKYRQMAMYVMRKYGYSLKQIGRVFKQHHTSVYHAADRAKDLMQVDENYRAQLNRIAYLANQP